jgi:hypothetical protein
MLTVSGVTFVMWIMCVNMCNILTFAIEDANLFVCLYNYCAICHWSQVDLSVSF